MAIPRVTIAPLQSQGSRAAPRLGSTIALGGIRRVASYVCQGRGRVTVGNDSPRRGRDSAAGVHI